MPAITGVKMRKNGRILFLLLVVGWLIWNGKPTFSAPATSPGPDVTILPDGLQLVWRASELVPIEQPDGTMQLTMADFGLEQTPGFPAVPVASVLLALPSESEPTLHLGERRVAERPFGHALAINPQAEGVVRDALGAVVGGGYAPADPQPYTPAVLSLTEVGVFRGVRLARLSFNPVRQEGSWLHVTQSVSATIQFNSPAALARPASHPDALQIAVATQIINPTQIAMGQATQQPEKSAAAVPTAFIDVAEPGITAVSYADLLAAGFPVNTVNPVNLQLWIDGDPRPLEWFGDGDALFEPGESIRFYAAPWFSRWQHNDVYRLTAGSSPGTRMGSHPASPSGLAIGSLTLTAVAEQNNRYTPDCLCGQLPAGRDGDRWVWEDLRQPGRPSATYAIDLPYVNPASGAELTLWAIGFTAIEANPDHNLTLTFNGTGIGSLSWDGKTAVTHTVSLPASSLQTGSSLGLAIPTLTGTSIDGLWLDGFAVRYSYNGSAVAANEQFFVEGASARRAYTVAPGSGTGLRLYDVTQPEAPALLSGTSWQNGQISWGDPDAAGHRYLVTNSSSLHPPAAVRLPRTLPSSSGVDYLIISHADFMPALAPLLALRQSQGLTSIAVDVQAIYDQFGNGRLTPEAIRSYLSQLYQSEALTYVLLVGDGTSDPKRYLADSKITWLPPYLADADPWIGEVAADNRYVAVDGDDFLPDMLIGRLPVNTLAEAQTVINKITAYETKPFLGDWNGRFTLVSDNTDAAGNFAAHSANLQQTYVSAPWQANSIAYNPPANTETAVKAAIQQSWQTSQGLLMYTGHSSIHQWGAERFFHLDDVAGLNNGARLPVVLEMTCFTASFQQPFWDTLDEALLRHADGGAVAVWGATGLGVGTGHDALASGFLAELMSDAEVRLGTAVLAGKIHLLTNQPINQDLLDTYTLLGDPATLYNTDFWPGIPNYLPIISR